jgi:hypothetical protein
LADSEERRHRRPGRRDTDTTDFTRSAAFEVVDDDVREIAIAIRKVQVGWKRWAAFCAAVVAGVSSIIGLMVWLGWTNFSPNDRFIQHDSTMRANVAAINNDVNALRQRVSNVEEAVDLMSYLLCVQIRRADPAAVPPKCNDPSIRNLAPR